MFRIIFTLLLLIHGFIHLIGFAKAFGWTASGRLAQPVSAPWGILWLTGGLLMFGTAIFYMMESRVWWSVALAGVLLSQILVIVFWSGAKYGTIINLLILVVALPAAGDWSFEQKVNEEVRMILSRVPDGQEFITEQMLEELPYPVERWLKKSGVAGKKKIQRIRLVQEGVMKTDPGQISWSEARAEQYFTTDSPAFVWKADLQMKPLLRIAGRDMFYQGEGEMLIKAFSLVNVVHARGNKIDQAALQRYLGEIVWFPTAALNSYIQWQAIDSTSAQAIMRYKGTSGSAVFHFDDDGDFTRFSTRRYRSGDNNNQLREWIVTVTRRKEMNGIMIPVQLEATWKLDSGDFTWYRFEVTEIEYF